jgi:REP element-mobilizing transposase RayT
MKYDPIKHHRRSIRLKGYDYHKAGAYFVTICTKNRKCILEDPIINGIIKDIWQALPSWFPTIELDEFIVMPNHIHFVIWILTSSEYAQNRFQGKKDGGGPRPYVIPLPNKINSAPALGDIVGAFKSLIFTVYLDWINANDPSRRAKFWQQNYYEHSVRNDRELNAVRQYIIDNPNNWIMDRDNLENIRKLLPPETVEEYLEDLQPYLDNQEFSST